MEFRQLEVYIKACELKSFSKAAQEMFLSQPSVSAYISSLEKELNTQLLHRSNKEFMLTKSGKVFFEHAKDMLTLRDKSIAKIKSLSDFTVGSIDIFASTVPSQYILPELLGEYHEKYPSVSFNIKQTDTQDVIESVISNKCEIGFVGSKIESAKCQYESIICENLLLITPCEERFSAKNLDIAEVLRTEYFVAREAGSGTRQEYEEYLRSIGIKPSELRISACFNNTQSIIHAVSNGLGVSIVSELAARQYIYKNRIVHMPIEGLQPRQFYAVTKKNLTPSATAQSFIDFVRAFKEGNRILNTQE